MDKHTLEKNLSLVARAISHWYDIVGCPGSTGLGRYTCPLCEVYTKRCLKCPIAIHTKLRHCEGTPFYKWADDNISCEERKEPAGAMVDLLLKLLLAEIENAKQVDLD